MPKLPSHNQVVQCELGIVKELCPKTCGICKATTFVTSTTTISTTTTSTTTTTTTTVTTTSTITTSTKAKTTRPASDPLTTYVNIGDESGSLDQLLNIETGVLPVDSIGIDFSLLEESLSSDNFTIDFMDEAEYEILESNIADYRDEPVDERGSEDENEFSFWEQLGLNDGNISSGDGSGDY